MLADELGIDVLDVCENIYGLDGTLVVDEYNILCVNPKHQDSTPSCNVNTTTGYFHCWSCDDKGDILTLGMRVLGKRYMEVRTLLVPDNLDAKRALLSKHLKGLQNPATASQPIRMNRQAWTDRSWLLEGHREPRSYRSGPMGYLYDRGFTDETIKRWGCRFVRVVDVPTKKRTATIRNSIAIPVFDETGMLMAWTYRATDGSESWQPRYLDTLGAPLGEVWHGIHLAGSSLDQVVVSEGPLDAMWIDQAGYTSLSIMGSKLPEAKLMELANFRKVILCFDDDLTGNLITRKVGELLWSHVPVAIARYPKFADGKDAQELAAVDVELSIERAMNWTSWFLRGRLALPAAN